MANVIDELQKRLEASSPFWSGHAEYSGQQRPKLKIVAALAQALGTESAEYLQVALHTLQDGTVSIQVVALTSRLTITVTWSSSQIETVLADVRSRRDLRQISIQPCPSGDRYVFSLRYAGLESPVVLGGEQQTEANYEALTSLYAALNSDLS